MKSAFCYIFIVSILALNAFLDDEESRIRPIKSFIQVAKIIIFIVGGITLIATLIGKSPLILLSGLGAPSAVLMPIFKDSRCVLV